MAIATQYSQPTHLYLSGGGSLLKGLDTCLEQAVGMKAVQLQPGQDGVSAQEGAVFALACAASQAASQHPGALNLLPQETRERERLSQRRRLSRAALLAAVIALLTFIFGSAFILQRREADLNRITPEWKEAVSDQSKQQEMAKQRINLISQTDFLTAVHAGKHSFLKLLLDIHQQAPKGIWLTNLVLEKSPPDADKAINTLQITGKAPDNIVVADLESKLWQISGMKAVSLQSSKQTRFEDKQVVEFSLSCQYQVPKPEPAPKDEIQAKGTKEAKGAKEAKP
jgi:Tfp pilus assembly protein PilN